jgi:hypothetical protein
MNRKIELTFLSDGRLKPSSTFIGHEGEHLATTLSLKYNDAFEDFNIHLKFENVDNSFLSEAIHKSGTTEIKDFEVPTSILKKGNVLCQLLFLEENGDIIKESSIITFQCGGSIGVSAEGINTTKGLINLITDGEGTKFLGDDGKYHYIEGEKLKIDNELSLESENPIQNKVITQILDNGKCKGVFLANTQDEVDELNRLRNSLAEGEYYYVSILFEWYNGSDYSSDGLYAFRKNNINCVTYGQQKINQSFDELADGLTNEITEKTNTQNQIISDMISTCNEATTIAKGKNRAKVFNTKADLDAWLEVAENKADLQVGDNLYIVEVGTPDYWWDGKQPQVLETQKVDLSQYATKEDLQNAINSIINANEVSY